MRRQDVDKTEFWKDRIKTAAMPHYSVYVVNPMSWKAIFDYHAKIIKEHIPYDAKVLDAGCGYGRMSVLFKDYTGVDFSPDFIEWAKKDYPDRNFIQGNLKSLPFENKEFDWVFCVSIKKMVQTYVNEDEWGLIERELKRVAKHILILEYDSETYEILC